MGHPVDDRIAHVDVGAGHVDPGAERLLPVGEFSRLHFFKQIKVLLDTAVTVRVVLSRLRQSSAVFAHLLCSQVGDVCLALFDELYGNIVHLLEIIGGIKHPVLIISAKPLHVLPDRIHELGLLLGRVRVVKPQVELAAVFLCQPVIEQDALGMSDVQISVGLGRKTRVYAGIDTVAQILINLLFYKMAACPLLFIGLHCRRLSSNIPACLFAHLTHSS